MTVPDLGALFPDGPAFFRSAQVKAVQPWVTLPSAAQVRQNGLMATSTAQTASGFPPSALRKDLARLVENGIAQYWLIQVGYPRLFRLNCVKREATESQGGDVNGTLADALVTVLKEAISRLGSEQNQIILTIVMGLDPRYPIDETSLEERRTAAGQLFRRGSRPVKFGTIRKYHERKALDQLTEVIISMEQATGEASELLSR
jgi:hypothetical protein